ncbi:MAG: hypothetical protein WCL38_01780 [Actinomycetota bacterium]
MKKLIILVVLISAGIGIASLKRSSGHQKERSTTRSLVNYREVAHKPVAS